MVPVKGSPKASLGPLPSFGSGHRSESRLDDPQDLVLLLLGLDQRIRQRATQKLISQLTFLSQPTVSRLLGSLVRRGLAKAVLPIPWARRHPEKCYELTPTGLAKFREVWDRLGNAPSFDPSLVLRDLVELNPSDPPLDLLYLCLRGIPFDVQNPQSGLAALNVQRQKVGPLPALSEQAVSVNGSQNLPASQALVGRFEERRLILSALRTATERQPRNSAILFMGPAGIGKTTLLQFARAAGERRGFRCRQAQAIHLERFPFYLVDDLSPDGPSSADPPVEDEPSKCGHQLSLSDRMSQAFRRLEKDTEKGPILLIVDSAENLTVAGLSMLEFLLFNIEDKHLPVVIVLAAQTGISAKPSLARVSERLRQFGRDQTGRLTFWEVPPLTPGESRALALQGLAPLPEDRVEWRVLEFLQERCQGNPLYIREWIRDLREGHASGTATGSQRLPWPPRVPVNLVRLVESQLSAVPPHVRTLLEMASMSGPVIDVPPLAALAQENGWGSKEEVGKALDELSRRSDLVCHLSRWNFAFGHPLVQEVCLAGSLHRRAWWDFLGGWWATHRPGEVGRTARFYYWAGNSKAGFPWIAKAVERALRSEEWEAAAEYVAWIAELLGTGDELFDKRVKFQLETVRELRWAGALRTAESLLQDVTKEPLPERYRWEAEENLIACLSVTDIKAARTRLESLLGAPQGSPPLQWQIPLNIHRSWISLREGNVREGLRWAQRSVQMIRRSDPSSDWGAYAGVAQASALLLLGRYTEALEVCRHFREPKDVKMRPALRVQVENLEGRIRIAMGNPREAREHLLRAWKVAQEAGRTVSHVMVLANLALAQIDLELWEDAEASIQNCLSISRRYSLPLPRAWALLRSGQLRLLREDPAARSDLVEAQKAFHALGMRGADLLCRTYLGILDARNAPTRAGIRRLETFRKDFASVPVEEVPPISLFMAGLWERLSDHPRALAEIQAGISEARASGRLLHEAHAHGCLAHWHRLHGSAKTAEFEHRTARRQYRRAGIRGVPSGDRYLGAR